MYTGLLFSATMKKKVEWLCRDILADPIRVVVGELGEVIQLVVHLHFLNQAFEPRFQQE